MYFYRMRNLLFFVMGLILFSCKKENITNDPSDLLQTSTDSLHFDTVFTSTGSITQFVRIINNNNKAIIISSVSLAGGSSSPFRINVDGVPGPEVNNLKIGENDSAYIFVTVTINPDASTLPFIVRDSIGISYNGNVQYIQLDAYGRNAHFFRNRQISGIETWNNDLPYVILGGITVEANAILNINKSCRIFMHADAPFIVNGTLNVNGEKYDSTRVVFTGDRLDEPYRDFPAGYPGIIFSNSSTNNVLNYATIKNAYQGIVVTGPSSFTKLRLNETIIDNAYDAGILAINSSIEARNVLVSNCGKNIFLVNGGQYNFTHCTAVSFSNNYIQHRNPVLVISNFLNQEVNDLNAVFRNCIFWGEENGLVQNEVEVLKQGNSAFYVNFDQVLWNVQNAPGNIISSGIINNQDPDFEFINTADRIYNFRLKGNSPALEKGVNTGILTDLDGNPRAVGLPDLGAYEKQ